MASKNSQRKVAPGAFRGQTVAALSCNALSVLGVWKWRSGH